MTESKSGGFPDALFLTNVGSSLYCSLCLCVLKDPTQCLKGHLFCRSCINRHISSKQSCPECRIDIRRENLSDSLFVRNIVSNLEVRCPTLLDPEEIFEKFPSIVTTDSSNTGTTNIDIDINRASDNSEELYLSCDWVGKLSDLDAHIPLCRCIVLECINRGCNRRIPQRLYDISLIKNIFYFYYNYFFHCVLV